MEVSLLKEITNDIQNWENIGDSDKLKAIRKLKSCAKIEKCSVPKESNMSCPEFKYELSTPCNLSQCEFYLNSPQNFNCTYHALDNGKKNRLTSSDVSKCLGYDTVNQVNTILNGAIQKIRIVRLEEEIVASRPNRFKHLTGHCVSCGMNIEDELDLGTKPNLTVDESVDHGYCSDSCKKSKTAWKFKLEKRFETDWEYVIYKSSQYLSTIKATHKDVEGMLGVDPASLKSNDKEKVKKYIKTYGLHR